MDTIALIGLLMAALLLIIVAVIQIHYQKKTIAALKDQLDISEKRLNAKDKEIVDLKWLIANPAKYKKGDKFGDLIVMSCEFYKPGLGHFITSALSTLACALLFHKDKKYIDSIDEEFKKKTEAQYMYHLANTVSGEKFYMREIDLTNLIPAEKQ